MSDVFESAKYIPESVIIDAESYQSVLVSEYIKAIRPTATSQTPMRNSEIFTSDLFSFNTPAFIAAGMLKIIPIAHAVGNP
jgi:hypothetical protein